MMKSITFIAILLQFISLINAERISKKNTNNRKSTNRNLRRDDLLRIAGSDRFDELLVASPSSAATAIEDTDDRFNELLGGATSSSSSSVTPKPTSGRFSIPTIYNPPSPPSSVASQAIPQPPSTLSPTSLQPTTKTNYWYPQRTTCTTTNTFTCHICILGSDYPSWMDDDSIATGYLFDTEEECCEEFDCDKSNSPSEGPTTEHPTFNRFTQWSPTGNPTVVETKQPSNSPSTLNPTHSPSTSPSTVDPSSSPSMKPITPMPSASPSQKPITMTPSAAPSHKPTTVKPSLEPSHSPTTSQPSNSPSQKPTQHPSLSPSTSQPSDSPTIQEDIIPLYNELDTSTYTEGTLVEVDGTVYECNGFPFTLYCKLPDYKPNSVDTNWQDVWIEVVTTESPTMKPSTASPTSRPSSSPLTFDPSVHPSQAPITLEPSMRPSLAPTTSKPTPQPVTQSPTNYPSQMPVTEAPITSTPSRKPSISPSLQPTSNAPTFNEITPFPTPTASGNNDVDTNDGEREVLYCPPQYNENIASTYDEGSQVSVNGIAYECAPFPFNIYCSMPNYRPQSLEEDTPWGNIWKDIGTCLVSDSPSISPTVRPSVSPTDEPTKRPTGIPTVSPSVSPSRSPSSKPTLSPSNEPTSSSPTISPSFYPTLSPSLSPSKSPTDEPSKEPSQTPSQSPSRSPSKMPSLSPVLDSASPTVNSKDSNSSQSLCSCAPRSFTVQIDPTKVSCNDDNNSIESNGGISKTECVWKNVIDDGIDADITPVNIKTRFVGFVELGNNRQVISRSVREADAEGNGDTFTFESISASLSPTESIDDQLNQVPYTAGLLFVGENTKGEELNASFMWYYSHSCDENGVTLVEEDVFGMNIWTSIEEPSSVFCPAATADESFIPSYDESALSTYTEGTLVELDGVVYKCNDFPFHLYCKLPEYKPGNSSENWQDVWTAIDAADTIMEPAVTASPTSQAPTTSKPSMRPSLQPVAVATSKPTSQVVLPVDQPTGVSSSCPPAYDEVAAPLYKPGSTVEVGGYIYICNGDPYGLYCSWSVFKPTVDGNKWQDTWTKLGPCELDSQSVPVRPSSESQPAPTPKPQSEKGPSTLVDASDEDNTHSPSKSPSAKSAKMMMAKSSKASGACGSKSSKKASSSSEEEKEESTVTATLTIELSDMSSVLNDTGTSIFEETCASFISDQLESDEICASDVECSITDQGEIVDDALSIDIEVDATGDNITNIDYLVEDSLGSSEFVEDCRALV